MANSTTWFFCNTAIDDYKQGKPVSCYLCKDKDIAAFMKSKEVTPPQPVDTFSPKKKQTSKTKVAFKGVKKTSLKTDNSDVRNGPMTRLLSSHLQAGNTTRSRYYKSGGSPLKWSRDVSEVARPLTKIGSVRYQRDCIRAGKS